MPKLAKPIIALNADVDIEAAQAESQGPRRFSVVAYTGGPMNVRGYDLPIVIDLAGLKSGKSLVANLDHDVSKRVGNVTSRSDDGGQLTLSGIASAATASRDEVIASADDGFVWQASIEANPVKIEQLSDKATSRVNGQEVTGPAYIVRTAVLKGFAFVSHGADDSTTVTIAATAGHSTGEDSMNKELRAFIEAAGFDPDNLTDKQRAHLEANFAGRNGPPATPSTFGDERAELQREAEVRNLIIAAMRKFPEYAEELERLGNDALASKWDAERTELQIYRAARPQSHTVFSKGLIAANQKLTNRVMEAAIAMTGRLANVEKVFDETTLEAAHRAFPNGLSLNQLLITCAQMNGYSSPGNQVTIDTQRAAFGMTGPRVQASGWSGLDIATILSNNANKFLMEGWNAIDMTPMRLAAVRPVNDFKTITTVSLTGAMQFVKVPPGGEIQHGALAELTYTNKADTYGVMLAITRTDIINDNLGALSAAPRKIGRGGALKLNDIFWTEFLNNSSFFTTARANVNEAVADATLGGLAATETIFMNQTDPDGKPLGINPAIVLCPPSIRAKMWALLNPGGLFTSGNTSGMPDSNYFAGRYRMESSPYMENSSYTGYSAQAWYLLADPGTLPVIEIAALNGRVEPVVETSDADFNVLGIQARGYSDIGVNLQEYRGGVRADGGAS